MVRVWGAYTILACSCALAFGYWLTAIAAGEIGADFAGTLWEPGRQVLEGRTPFPNASLYGSPSVYPPPVIIAFVPLALLPFGVAAAIMCIVLLAAAAGAVHVLGLRDWFVYGAVLSSFAVTGGSSWGNSTALMVFFVALAWRDRPRSWLWVACAILVKLWMLPLLLWLVFTRTRQALIAALALVAALTVAWTVTGGDGLTDYPARLSGLEQAHSENGILLYALVLRLSGSAAAGLVVSLGVAAVLCAVARSLDEQRMFQLILVACLVAAPIFWSSYLTVLTVVIAVSSRRDDRLLWACFALSWLLIVSPSGQPRPVWLIAATVVAVATVSVLALGIRPRRRAQPRLRSV